MKWVENSAFSRSVWRALCWLNALLNWVELGVYLCVCVHTWGHGCVDWVFVRMCVCVSWQCLKVVLTVHTQTAPEESASLVDPLCILCVCVSVCVCWGLGSGRVGVFAQGVDHATLCKCVRAWMNFSHLTANSSAVFCWSIVAVCVCLTKTSVKRLWRVCVRACVLESLPDRHKGI